MSKSVNNIDDYMNEYMKMPLFAGIGHNELKELLTCMGAYAGQFKKGDYIIFCEDSVKAIGVIIEGSVAMLKEDLWGNKSLLTVMNQYQLFGETFVCNYNVEATVSFCSMTPLTVLFLPFDKVLHRCSIACTFHHRMIENMLSLIAEKNVRLMEKVDIMSKKTLREKIFTYLAINAQHADQRYFTIPLGRVQLSEYLCADRSAVTRELNSMKEDGLIDFEKNTFRILKNL